MTAEGDKEKKSWWLLIIHIFWFCRQNQAKLRSIARHLVTASPTA